MTNAHRFLQNLVVFGSVVPLAIFLGYLIVVPPDMTTYGTYALVFLVLTFPLLLRYHHPLLILSWNVSLVVPLRGSPQLWLLIAFLSFGVIMVRRTLGRGFRMQSVPALTAPLVVLTVLVIGTALVRGGIGLGAFGSAVGGGKRYLFILGAIVGYFALSSQKIPEHRARLAVVLFFFSSVSYAVGALLPYVPEAFYFIFSFFPPETMGLELSGGEIVRADQDIGRTFVLTVAFAGIVKGLLAYYGIRRLLDLKRPWLTISLVAAIGLTILGGFRSALISILLVFCLLFLFEGLLKTRIFWGCVILGLAGLATIVPVGKKLPYSIQRTLSVIPFVEVDPLVKIDADYSTEWRLRMWDIVLPTVPQYLAVGKGFAIDQAQLQVLNTLVQQRRLDNMEISILSGDYHNGPLSLVIPLGLAGVAAVLWFFAAGTRALWLNYKWSPPELRNVNRFLFVSFVSSVIFFCSVYGSFYNDLAAFTGLAGLSVGINGGVRRGVPASTPIPAPQQTVAAAAMSPSAVSQSAGAA